MKKPIEIYALVICFFALIWFAVTLSLFFNQVVRITFPQLTTPISNYGNQAILNNPGVVKNKADKAANDLRVTAWKVNYEMAIEQEKRDAFRNMIYEIISLVISTLIFIPHWKLGRRESLS